MQKIATRIFIVASTLFGALGITVVITRPADDNFLTKTMMCTAFVVLSSFALSVAGKYLSDK